MGHGMGQWYYSVICPLYSLYIIRRWYGTWDGTVSEVVQCRTVVWPGSDLRQQSAVSAQQSRSED